MKQDVQSSRGAELNTPIRRILVATKYRFIGDTLLAVPLLRALAEQWPDARISLLTGAKACEVVKYCPFVHETIEFDPYRKCDKSVGSYMKLIAKLRRQQFDLAMVCNRSFHSALTAYLAGAPYRVGWSGFEMRDFLLTHMTPYSSDAPEIEAYLDLVKLISTRSKFDSRAELWLDANERSSVRRMLPASPVIGIQPGASHAEKQWPPERFAELASRLLRLEPSAHIVLIGGPDERASAEAMLQSALPEVRERTISLVGELSLRQTLAVLTHVQLFVAADTAIRHAAMAVDAPSVALFGPTSISKWGNAEPPRHAALSALDGDVCSLSVDEVFGAAVAAYGTARANFEPGIPLPREVSV